MPSFAMASRFTFARAFRAWVSLPPRLRCSRRSSARFGECAMQKPSGMGRIRQASPLFVGAGQPPWGSVSTSVRSDMDRLLLGVVALLPGAVRPGPLPRLAALLGRRHPWTAGLAGSAVTENRVGSGWNVRARIRPFQRGSWGDSGAGLARLLGRMRGSWAEAHQAAVALVRQGAGIDVVAPLGGARVARAAADAVRRQGGALRGHAISCQLVVWIPCRGSAHGSLCGEDMGYGTWGVLSRGVPTRAAVPVFWGITQG